MASAVRIFPSSATTRTLLSLAAALLPWKKRTCLAMGSCSCSRHMAMGFLDWGRQDRPDEQAAATRRLAEMVTQGCLRAK